MPINGDGYFYLVKPVIYATKEGMKMKGHMDKVLAAAVAAYDRTLFKHVFVPNRLAVASSRETKRDQIFV